MNDQTLQELKKPLGAATRPEKAPQLAPADPARPESGPEKAGPPQEGETSPEEYLFETPEGFDPGRHLDEFRELAGKMKLEGPKARELVNFWVNVAREVEEEREDAWLAARKEWAVQTARDHEIGGANLEKSVHLAARAVNAFGTDGLKEVFRMTGLGNHPEVVRFFTRVGATLGEDSFHAGTLPQGQGPKSAAELIYGRR